jgi:hypothetical protein
MPAHNFAGTRKNPGQGFRLSESRAQGTFRNVRRSHFSSQSRRLFHSQQAQPVLQGQVQHQRGLLVPEPQGQELLPVQLVLVLAVGPAQYFAEGSQEQALLQVPQLVLPVQSLQWQGQ